MLSYTTYNQEQKKFFVFRSHGNPNSSDPYMTFNHPVTPTLAPVLKKLAKQYSPVSSKSLTNLNISRQL